jgi:hypothetical protein
VKTSPSRAKRTTKAQATRRKPASGAAATERKAAASKEAKRPAAAPPAPADTAIRTEGDTQVKVMEFRGLDIEGQLRTPQMLYFLNRMRAEFGRPRLPHRSFMPELSRSARERVF